MESTGAERLVQMPDEMISFTLQATLARHGARVGRLALKSRSPITTPNYVATTSRGVVPHLSQDNVAKHTKISSFYFGIEDFIEKEEPKIPPIYKASQNETSSALRSYTSNREEAVLILGPRRVPPVVSPQSNSNSKLAICTSVGFKYLDVGKYVSAGTDLGPDILLAPGDIVIDHRPSQKRAEKMGDRSAAWLRDAAAFKEAAAEKGHSFALFAPILPIDHEMQNWYLRELVDDFRESIDGLYVHDARSVVDLPEVLQSLPRVGFLEPTGPNELLHQISLGVDLFVIPFVSTATDAGTALTFAFPSPSSPNEGDATRNAIGIDLWDSSIATDVSPFEVGCNCYTCQKHHKAYLHHLLSAKEMLAWVLIQIHNHHVMDRFFAAVRDSIEKGTFEQDKEAFERFYEPELPLSLGQGPRVRGYQIKSLGGGESKKNFKAFNKLDDMAEALAEADLPSPNVDAGELEDHGLGRTA